MPSHFRFPVIHHLFDLPIPCLRHSDVMPPCRTACGHPLVLLPSRSNATSQPPSATGTSEASNLSGIASLKCGHRKADELAHTHVRPLLPKRDASRGTAIQTQTQTNIYISVVLFTEWMSAQITFARHNLWRIFVSLLNPFCRKLFFFYLSNVGTFNACNWNESGQHTRTQFIYLDYTRCQRAVTGRRRMLSGAGCVRAEFK